MKRFFGVVFLVVMLGFVSVCNSNAYYETFDSNAGGFHYGYGTSYTDGSVSWLSSGGNPDGNISGQADNLYAVWLYASDIGVSSFGNMTGMTQCCPVRDLHEQKLK